MISYGISRVLEPKHVLPTSAWHLDNQRTLLSHELRIQVKKIQLERTSFKQLLIEANYNEEKLKQKIIDIVIRRGKLHNPVTDTGGICYGIIDQIDSEYENKGDYKVGDEVIANASLASIPLYIEDITSIDYAYNQINVSGYAILKDTVSLIKVGTTDPLKLLLYILDESGTIYRLSNLVGDKQKFLVVGNNMLTNIIYGYTIRRLIGRNGEIVCILDKKTDATITGKGVDEIVSNVFDEVHLVDILKPIECVEKLNFESYFDLTINCAEIPGAETINILATKEGGTVLFANLINNLNIAVYITEALSKNIEIRGAEGFLQDYDKLDLSIAKELYKSLKSIEVKRASKEKIGYTRKSPYDKNIQEQALLEDFVCESESTKLVLEEILKVSKYDCNVIIFGDTGVGKEKAANIIQKNSDRRMQPFLKINCGAISPNLIESEFFGYEKGAFTGANANGKKGYFEVANNGIMFLDEIGELPLDMQAKFLRVIQDGEFYRVGGTTPIKTNVRIISATNRNLEEMVEEGKFRRDLYYRLNVVPIHIPKLKERKEEIPHLVRMFLNRYRDTFKKDMEIDDGALEYLIHQPWEGNIRELENVVQRLMISAKGEYITLMDVMRETESELFPNVSHKKSESDDFNLVEAVDAYEKSLIKDALKKHGSTRKAAKAIGISQTQLVRKKKKFDL